jgi:hypothetical protein
MIDSHCEAVCRIGAEAQLDPVRTIVRVDAADFHAPFAARGLERAAVEVDKKLVCVGNNRRDGASKPYLYNHGRILCIFVASARGEYCSGN